MSPIGTKAKSSPWSSPWEAGGLRAPRLATGPATRGNSRHELGHRNFFSLSLCRFDKESFDTTCPVLNFSVYSTWLLPALRKGTACAPEGLEISPRPPSELAPDAYVAFEALAMHRSSSRPMEDSSEHFLGFGVVLAAASASDKRAMHFFRVPDATVQGHAQAHGDPSSRTHG